MDTAPHLYYFTRTLRMRTLLADEQGKSKMKLRKLENIKEYTIKKYKNTIHKYVYKMYIICCCTLHIDRVSHALLGERGNV